MVHAASSSRGRAARNARWRRIRAIVFGVVEIEAHSFSDHGGSFRTHKFIPKFIPKSIQSGQQCSFQLQDIS